MINLDNRDALSGKVDIEKLALKMRKSAEDALRDVAGEGVLTETNIAGVIRIAIERRMNAQEAVQAWADELRAEMWRAAARSMSERFKEKK